MAYITIVSKSTTSVTLRLNGLDQNWANGTRTTRWYLGNPNGGRPTEDYYYKYKTGKNIENGASSGGDVTFTGIVSGSNYSVLCVVYHNSNYVNDFEGEFVTDEASPWNYGTNSFSDAITDEQRDNLELFEYYIQIYEFTFAESGTARFYATGSVDTFGFISLSAEMNSDGSAPLSVKVSDDNSYDGMNFDIKYDVTAGKKYYLFVRGASGLEEGYATVHIVPPGSFVSVDKWDWSSSNGNADTTTTYNSYLALFDETKSTEEFSHEVWNDMVQKAYDIIWQKTKYWDSTYGTVASTKFSAEPYELTAKMFNSLRNNLHLEGDNLGLSYQSGTPVASPGDDVMGWYFTALTEYMNDCIDNL